MPSIMSRLAGLFPSFRSTYAPAVPTPEERAAQVIAATKRDIERSRARPRPSSEEKIPTNYYGGAAGKVWFLPYLDSTTQDSPEIRAAMRLMRRSPWVKAAWEPQILTVASEDWQVQASEPGNPESEEQADFCKAMIEECIHDAMIAVVRAICAPFGSEGHSLAEPVWNVCEKGKLAKKIVCTKFAARDTDPNTGDVRLMGDGFGNVTHVEARRAPGQPVYPIDDFVFSRYLTVFDEPLGEAAYRPSYGSYWMLDTVDKLRMVHCEKRMAGMLVGTYENDDDKPGLEDTLRKAKTATWAAIPDGVKLEALQISTASEPDYKSFQESLRDALVTGIAFATLQIIQGNVPDARGDTKVQKSMADLGPWLLMTLVCSAVNRQLFPKAIDFNYPYPAGGAYPKLTFGAASNQELLELVQVVTGAQQIGFTNLSRKHYAKALSLQLADPNDPDDSLASPQQAAPMGGFGGGFGGDPGMGGAPAALPPGPGVPPTYDPSVPEAFGEGGGVDWESFAWSPAQTARGTIKAEWTGPGQRRPLYGVAAKKALSQTAGAGGTAPPTPSGSGPIAPPSLPAKPAAPPVPAAPKAPAPPVPGKLKRVAGAVGRGAKVAARAKYNAGKKAVGGTVYGAAKLSQGLAYAVDRLGALLQKTPVLESVFGVGSTLRKEAGRKMRQARETAALAAAGDRSAAARRAASASAKLAAIKFGENRRKFGTTRAVVIEAAYWGLKAALGGAVAAGALAITGTSAAGLATAGIGALAAYKVSKTVLGMVVNPLIRQAVEYPFRYGKGKRGKNAPHRVAERELQRRAARAGFAEDGTSGDPLDLVAALREMLELDLGRPVEIPDAELAQLLADLLDYSDELGEGADEEIADAFAEVPESEWESFGWQAGRTRRGSVKAIGTAEDRGKTLYGAKARAALAKKVGASKRQDAPRTVTYTTTDNLGNTKPKREENVSPERARAMAVAAQLAATEPVGERPTGLKVRKQRLRTRHAAATTALEAVAQKATAGDSAAVKQLADTGKSNVEAAAKELAKLGPVPAAAKPVIRAAWLDAAKGLPRGQRREVQTLLDATFGEFGRDTNKVAGAVGKIAAWIGRQTYGVARATVGALARFSKGLARASGPLLRGLAGLGWKGTKLLARAGAKVAGVGLRAGWRATKALAAAGGKHLGPFGYWAGAVVGGAALLAAPVLAVKFGLVPFAAGIALAPVAVGGVGLLGRRLGQRAADSGLRASGEGFIVPADKHSESAAEPGDEHALAGADGKRATQLLASAQADGARVFAEACKAAVKRLLASPNPLAAPVLFDDGELGEVAGALARTVATADLMGRARIRRHAQIAEKASESFADGKVPADYSKKYSDPFHDFAEPVPSMEPVSALEYFRRLVPTLGASTVRYGPKLDRHAFTLAVAADQTVLEKVKGAIVEALRTGKNGTPDVEQILDDAGVSERDPRYAEMVVRTNVMDAYNQGAQDELSEPDVQERFPAWEYLGVLDSRTGDDHKPKIGKYFPSSVSFAEVRGPRVYNCRCSFAPVSRFLMSGVRVEERW